MEGEQPRPTDSEARLSDLSLQPRDHAWLNRHRGAPCHQEGGRTKLFEQEMGAREAWHCTPSTSRTCSDDKQGRRECSPFAELCKSTEHHEIPIVSFKKPGQGWHIGQRDGLLDQLRRVQKNPDIPHPVTWSPLDRSWILHNHFHERRQWRRALAVNTPLFFGICFIPQQKIQWWFFSISFLVVHHRRLGPGHPRRDHTRVAPCCTGFVVAFSFALASCRFSQAYFPLFFSFPASSPCSSRSTATCAKESETV